MIEAFPAEWLLYLRKSVGYAGIDRQRKYTTEYIERRGGRVIEGGEFSDADRTAFRNGLDDDPDAPLPPRPGFDAMLAEMSRRPGVGVAAWHADRFGRDVEAGEIFVRAARRGRHLIATKAGGDYDVTTANGRDHFRTDILRAVGEVDHNVERLIDAKAEAAGEGRWLGGLRPFGWRPATDGQPGDLELVEAEAEAIRQGSAGILAGISVRAVARAWNDAGLTGTGGGRWTTSTVHKVLSRPRNAGFAEHHGKIVAADGNPVRARWQPVVDEVTWRAVSAILSDPARRANKGGTAASHLMSGIALCGGCGVAVVVNASADGTPRYRCSRHARGLAPTPGPHASRKAADVDAYVAALAVGRLKRHDAALLLAEDRGGERAGLILRRTAAEVKSRKDFELYQADVITDLELAAARKRTREQLAEIDEKLRAVEQADAVAPFLADPEGKWDDALLDERRAVVSALMHVTLMPGAKCSRPPGWKPGDGQFDPRMVDVRWARHLPSDG
jgi:site-specific DNA recombinase